ncbi:hypothetical protein [Salinigranum marinum]|uniref:hypothetical protein n=1 Tax=Salinigranum marinum TaxID=1515595 RepID=UPI00298A0351|nr:hypothetical protein [Salinigranum marinum]
MVIDSDSEFELIPLTEFDRLRDALDRFCAGGVDGDDERIRCRFGGATFSVSRTGAVEAGMPLHGFEAADVEAIGVDPAAGKLLVETAAARYVFRHP